MKKQTKAKPKKKKKKKGFTLIELLAVIVILGLLMAIAIPSVTKYITQSRKKTVTTTIGNYIGAITTQVNDMEYVFTATNTIYAVPIECISLERGGTDPFGKWLHANSKYWAYVLVQYNDVTSSYTYGFTFKDSAGYGLYPTTSEKLKESGSQIQTDLDLSKPVNGSITNVTSKDNWKGFVVDDNTKLHVLEATGEGEKGDGKTTCTLAQKGDNYAEAEQEKDNRLGNQVKNNNELILDSPTLTTSNNNSSDKDGLYVSYATNSGSPTYYFRGNVTNNYVKFANELWRIIRINEDGSVRLIKNTGINNDTLYKFSNKYNNYTYMYYSVADTTKPTIDNWYNTNIVNAGFDSYVVESMFCEQAKVKEQEILSAGKATMSIYTEYTPTFKCENDANGKGILNLKVGLITYDEVTFAGGFYNTTNSNNFLSYGTFYWTMSPAGFYSPYSYTWHIRKQNNTGFSTVNQIRVLRPVINLRRDVIATGTGTSSDPFVVQIG